MTPSPPPDLSAPQTCSVLGSALAVTDYKNAVALTQSHARGKNRAFLVAAANTHVVALARHQAQFRGALQQFDLLLPDGMPLVWCINRASRAQLRDRVYGPTFMLRALEASGGNFSHYLLGGSDELLGALQEKLAAKFPTLRIAGAYAPPFGQWPEDEDARILGRIAQSGADFVWIGLGCPKQELWLARNKSKLPPAVYCAVGAAFAFHAGRVPQAPAWMQDRGLEWLYRLLSEPRRLWKRYLVYNSLFAFYLAKDAIGGKTEIRKN